MFTVQLNKEQDITLAVRGDTRSRMVPETSTGIKLVQVCWACVMLYCASFFLMLKTCIKFYSICHPFARSWYQFLVPDSCAHVTLLLSNVPYLLCVYVFI